VASSTWRNVAVLALIAPTAATAVALPVWGVGGPYFYVIPVAVAAAILVGGPALNLAGQLKWRRFDQLMILGTVGGALCPGVAGLLIGLVAGRPGSIEWRFFFSFEPLTILIGGLSAATFWLTRAQSRFSRLATMGMICVVFLIAELFLYAWLWSKGLVPTIHGAHHRPPHSI
jgi:hypothetical protein